MEPTYASLSPDPGAAPRTAPGESALPADKAGEAGQRNTEAVALQRERDALRIQAAAVAAQQAALLDEEARFLQRRLQLEQQEKQLAGHLDEKRRQLLQLRDQVRQAREELQQQRKRHAAQVGNAATDLTHARQEVEENRRHVRAERHRLFDLRRHLKHRFHRNWLSERKTQQRREEELAARCRTLEREKADLLRERLRFNGESELGRRQIQDGWQELHRAEGEFRQRQGQHQERGRLLDRRAAELDRAGRRLEEAKRQWQEQRRLQEKEAQGIDARLRNHRRKILDQQQEILRLEAVIAARGVQAGEREPAAMPLAEATPPATPSSPEPEPRAGQLPETEAEFGRRLAVLEHLAGDLADQRLHLVEQGERLLRARLHWQQEHDAAAAELEAVARRFQDREVALQRREQAMRGEEAVIRRRFDEAVHLRHYLEGCQARVRVRVAEWEGERDRLLVEVQDREHLANQRLQVLGTLHGRWQKRRRNEQRRHQAALAGTEKLRQEYTTLRDGWLRRHILLEQKERELTEQTLALDQLRQEVIGQAPDSPAAEKHLEKLRRRWAALSEALQRTLAQERAAFETEKTRLEKRHAQIENLGRQTQVQEEKLIRRQTAWEQEQAQALAIQEQQRLQLHTLAAQRQRCERQMEDLRDEVERIARLLLEGNEPMPVPLLVQAA